MIGRVHNGNFTNTNGTYTFTAPGAPGSCDKAMSLTWVRMNWTGPTANTIDPLTVILDTTQAIGVEYAS
jgi:hypothetical protein